MHFKHASHSIVDVSGLAMSRTAVAAGVSTAGVHEFLDGVVALLVRDHRNRQFSLCSITRFHDLTDSQPAVLYWDVGLLTVS